MKTLNKYPLLLFGIVIFSIIFSLNGCDSTSATIGFGTIEGKVVVGESDAPLMNIAVTLDEEIVTTTDHEGNFRFEDVPEGEHTISVNPEGFHGYGAGINLEKDQIRNLTIYMSEDNRTVRFGGTVYNEHQEPIQGALVIIDGRQQYTSEDGTFLFPMVSYGWRVVKVSHDNYQQYISGLSVLSDIESYEFYLETKE